MIHIMNGDVTAAAARRAGIGGEVLSFRESLACGPVPRDVDVETRARFLADGYGHNLLRVRNDLLEQERALAAAAEHDEIVLWFEHDLFCLANLLALLDRFAAHRRLSLVWCREPLGTREHGELPTLFDSRFPVTPALLAAAREAWSAYTADDPAQLNELIARDHSDFPFLRDGLTLHASRFPSMRNGLGEVENRIVTLVATGISDFATLFNRLDESHPRFALGDSEVLRVARTIAWCAVPIITLVESEEGIPKTLLGLAPAAANVLEGAVDNLTLNDPDLWFGGVHVTKENVWRWDAQRRQVVRSRPAGS